jgi:GT2 family glycosyltransferase
MLLSIVIVNFNSGSYLADCIKSITDSNIDFDYEIIVVDNASSDDSLTTSKRLFPDIKYIENPDNRGFGKANNQGIDLARGKYVLIQNPDTLVNGTAIRDMVAYAGKNKDIGIMSAKLLNKDGTLQWSIHNYPDVLTVLFEGLFLHRLFPGLSRRIGLTVHDKRIYDASRDVDWITGAIMLVDTEAIKTVGKFDERFFLYVEEVDWCYRMRKQGWRVHYFAEAGFTHYLGNSKGSQKLFIQYQKASVQYASKHFSAIRRFMFCLAILVYLANRMLVESIKLVLGRTADGKIMVRRYFSGIIAVIEMMIKGADLAKYNME